MVKCLAVIPARIGSTRLSAKPLASIQGTPMVRLVYENAVATELFDEVIVATDDERIREVIAAAGGRAVMTRADHASGTDRVAEVAEKADAEIVVNIQGDLPFVSHPLLAPLIGTMVSEPALRMATVAVPIRDRERWLDRNVVKVVTDERDFALYFSRAPIPARRDPQEEGTEDEPHGLQHVGVYAYRRDFLLRFTSWPPSRLERLERLEQLRALERGTKIFVARVSQSVVEVDTAEDLERANELARQGAISSMDSKGVGEI
jgi:3-deoxy-manno-octulosonate cytidylyltransferase (CMP-KDO synthetase)